MNNKTVSILLVEDNKLNQLVAVKILQGWGMYVKVANHGREALALVGSKSFHLILMDLNMPEMDGYESTRRIREMEDVYFKTIPIMAFSDDKLEAREKAIQSGMTDSVAKPLQQKELQGKIDQYVVRNRGNDNGLKPLTIDFERYTGLDAMFKKELISLMMVDIQDLIKSLHQAIQLNDPEIFRRGRHKAKTTVCILDDAHLTVLLQELEVQILEGSRSEVFQTTSLLFNNLTQDLLKSLSQE